MENAENIDNNTKNHFWRKEGNESLTSKITSFINPLGINLELQHKSPILILALK